MLEIITRNSDYYVHKQTDPDVKSDSSFMVFKNEESARKIIDLEPPGCLACILQTKSWKNYTEELKQARKSGLFEMETSHDYPCIVIRNSIYASDDIENHIITAARQLNIEIHKNNNLPALDRHFLFSNKTFDLE